MALFDFTTNRVSCPIGSIFLSFLSKRISIRICILAYFYMSFFSSRTLIFTWVVLFASIEEKKILAPTSCGKKPDISSLLQRIKSMADVLFTMIYLFLFYQVRIKHTRNYVLKHGFIFKYFVSISVHHCVTIQITFFGQTQL